MIVLNIYSIFLDAFVRYATSAPILTNVDRQEYRLQELDLLIESNRVPAIRPKTSAVGLYAIMNPPEVGYAAAPCTRLVTAAPYQRSCTADPALKSQIQHIQMIYRSYRSDCIRSAYERRPGPGVKDSCLPGHHTAKISERRPVKGRQYWQTSEVN